MSYIPSIDVHFSRFKTASDTLRDLTNELEALATGGFDCMIQDLKSSWEEEGADMFVHSLRLVGNELYQEADKMTEVVDEIEKEALLVFDAELFSRGLAFTRSY